MKCGKDDFGWYHCFPGDQQVLFQFALRKLVIDIAFDVCSGKWIPKQVFFNARGISTLQIAEALDSIFVNNQAVFVTKFRYHLSSVATLYPSKICLKEHLFRMIEEAMFTESVLESAGIMKESLLAILMNSDDAIMFDSNLCDIICTDAWGKMFKDECEDYINNCIFTMHSK
jgi:hypothetical protein